MSILIDTTNDDAGGTLIDQEITSLRSQINTLKAQRALQAQTIISSQTTHSILNNLRALAPNDSQEVHLLATATAQRNQVLTTLYRACTGITTFNVQDPDPNALDEGHVLGVRIDVSNHGRFIRPYYIMLNRAFLPSSNHLRVHRHTCPPCIPVAHLAARFLPAPNPEVTSAGEQQRVNGVGGRDAKQDIKRFVRNLRREIISYHLRLHSIKQIRKQFKLDDKPDAKQKGKGREGDRVIEDVSAVDAEAKQLRIQWVDGRVGRAVMDGKGNVRKCVVIGEDGRDGANERRIVGDKGRIEGIGERLLEGIY